MQFLNLEKFFVVIQRDKGCRLHQVAFLISFISRGIKENIHILKSIDFGFLYGLTNTGKLFYVSFVFIGHPDVLTRRKCYLEESSCMSLAGLPKSKCLMLEIEGQKSRKMVYDFFKDLQKLWRIYYCKSSWGKFLTILSFHLTKNPSPSKAG